MSENLAEDEHWGLSLISDVQYVISQSTFAIWQLCLQETSGFNEPVVNYLTLLNRNLPLSVKSKVNSLIVPHFLCCFGPRNTAGDI